MNAQRMAIKPNYLYWPGFLAIFAIFAFSLVVYKLINVCFYFFVLIAIATLLFQRQGNNDFKRAYKQYWPVMFGMAGTIIALFLRQLSEGVFILRHYELPSRLAIFTLFFWFLLQLPINHLKKIKWAFISGAILYALKIYIESHGGEIRLGTVNAFSVIFSSELALLMGVFSVLSINWEKYSSKLTLAFQLAGGLAGLISVYLAQARGAWLPIPIFALIIASTLMRPQKTRTKIITYFFILTAIAGILNFTHLTQERIEQGKQDIIAYTEKKNPDTSLGTRIQLWNASWIIFKANPFFGVGKEHFDDALHSLSKQGIITPNASSQYHSHNEFLYSMATLGMFGLIATLLLYVVPAVIFVKKLFHPDRQIYTTATMGCCLCLGYFIFGLVDVMFGWNMCAIFYSTSIAIFLALIFKRQSELALLPNQGTLQ